MQTLGDDWPFYGKYKNAKDVFDYYTGLINSLQPGEVAGIGFHPWIIFSDEKILKGFTEFMQYLGGRKDICLNTALSFVRNLELL